MSLTVLWPPFHLCKFADIAFDARPSPSPTTTRSKGRRQRSSISGATLFLPLFPSSPFAVGPSGLHTHACLSLPTCPSFVCPCRGYQILISPALPPCGFGLARWMTRFGPRAVSQPPFLPLFSSPSLSRDTRFIESTGGGMRQTSGVREGRNVLQTE